MSEENGNREIFESYEFELDHRGDFKPNQNTSPTTSTEGVFEQNNTGSNTTLSVDSDNIEGREVESTNEIVELDTVDNSLQGTDLESEEPKEESDEMEFDFGEEPNEETEPEEVKEDDRITQLENKIKELSDNKTFEEKFSKDKMLTPGVSEYDYALMGKDFAEKGSLTDEQYSKLEQLGYSKEFIDSFGNQQFQQNQQQQPAQPSEADVKNDFAGRLDMSVGDLDGLLDNVKTVFTDNQKEVFDNSAPEKQIEILQNFRLQKLQHEQKLKDRKLIKGNGTAKEQVKSEFADVSDKDIQSKFLKAINNGEAEKMLAFSKELLKRGINPNF